MLGLKLNHVSKRGHLCHQLASSQHIDCNCITCSCHYRGCITVTSHIRYGVANYRKEDPPEIGGFVPKGLVMRKMYPYHDVIVDLRLITPFQYTVFTLINILLTHWDQDKMADNFLMKFSNEPMMDSLLTHICVTRPRWIKRGRFL